MSDPTRLLDETDSELVRSLLEQAASEPPPPGAQARLLEIGLATVPRAAPRSSARFVKALGIGSAVVIAGAIAVAALRPRPEVRVNAPVIVATETTAPAPTIAPPISSAPEPNPIGIQRAPVTSAAPSLGPSVKHVAPPASTARSTTKPSLSDEVAMLDSARVALRADPRASLAQLDAYDARFPQGTLAPEAKLLRIEALLKSGDRPAAEALARPILESEPSSAYGRKVRYLLGQAP
jgi:hypothetical protein